MAKHDALEALEGGAFTRAMAQHLLTRAGFGGPPSQVESLQRMGLRKAVDLLVDFELVDASALEEAKVDAAIYHPPTPEEKMALEKARKENDPTLKDRLRNEFLKRQEQDRLQMVDLEKWWMARMIATPRPLEEKLTLLWHSHFASNFRTVHHSYMMYQQNQLFRKNAAGSFADLALAIVHDPAMIRFLNNDQNRKAHPNENLARELMELFTLGEGHYTEDDIKQGARALTGYSYAENNFRYNRPNHDDDIKEILGQKGNFDGEAFVDILLQQPACAVWVAFKLHKHFVGDIDEGLPGATSEQKAVIQQLAQLLRDSKYQLKPVLKTLFCSKYFYDANIVGKQIKSPVQILVGTMRMLQPPQRDLGMMTMALAGMGQRLFEPPSVAGWDGGRSWINTSTLFIRQNLVTYLLTGKMPNDPRWSKERINYDPMPMVNELSVKSPETIVERMTAILLSNPLPAVRKAELVTFMQARSTMDADAIMALMLLITAMPEYQLC